ncbi:MAG: purine permease [Spirochaetaceae bacterium]|nr:purine permease [Spirochaetaceae bacterium]
MSKSNADVSNIFTLEGRVPLYQAVPFGVQHILAMFVPNIAPITLLFGAAQAAGTAGDVTLPGLIQACMFCAGIVTLIQIVSLGGVVGSRLPVVMGISFTFLAASTNIVTKYGYAGLAGAVIAGGCIEGLLGLSAKYWKKLIPPVVSGSVVMSIGISIFAVGVNSFGGGGNWLLYFGAWQCWLIGGITLLTCILVNCLVKGISKQLNVLFALIVGYIVTIIIDNVAPVVGFDGPTKLVNFGIIAERVSTAGIVALPSILPGGISFHLDAIIQITIVFLVSAVETIGDTTTLCQIGLDRDITEKEVSGSLAADGFGSAIAGVFGCSPITSFSQNVGLVGMTKVVNRFAIGTGAAILVLCGLIPALGGVFSTIPEPVLGGCTIIMFGTIMSGGIGMLHKAGMSQRNTLIVALSCSFGIGVTFSPTVLPQALYIRDIFGANMVAGVFVIAFILNLVLPKDMEIKRG